MYGGDLVLLAAYPLSSFLPFGSGCRRGSLSDQFGGVADALAADSGVVIDADHKGAAGGQVVDAEDVVIAKSHSVVMGLHCASLSFPDWGFVGVMAGIGRTTFETFSTLDSSYRSGYCQADLPPCAMPGIG
jgi:hypothetical protein